LPNSALPLALEEKAAGEVLTAKHAPHRPGTAPALGLRAGCVDAPIVAQTALVKEDLMWFRSRFRAAQALSDNRERTVFVADISQEKQAVHEAGAAEQAIVRQSLGAEAGPARIDACNDVQLPAWAGPVSVVAQRLILEARRFIVNGKEQCIVSNQSALESVCQQMARLIESQKREIENKKRRIQVLTERLR
jgi:hypothetical protein